MPLRWLRLATRAVLFATAASVVLVLLTMLAVRTIVVPRIGDYRDEITSLIARNIGRSVSIGELVAGWDGWSPTLTLVDFRLLDAGGREALALPRIETSLSWRSLVGGELTLRRLEVSGAQLLVRRDVQGRISVAGVDMEHSAESQDNAAAEWFASQRRVVIRNGTLIWHDELRAAPPLRLEQVNLVLENSGTRHRFGLTAVPPAALAAPLDLRGEVTLPTLAEWQRAAGRVYTRLDFVDVAQAKAWLPLPFDLKSGRGALRTWLEFDAGEPRDVTLDLELDDVRTRLKSSLPELDLAHVAGRIAWRRAGAQTDLSTKALELTTKNGARLAPGDIAVRYAAASDGKPASGEIKSSQLQLAPIFALLQYLPLEDKLRTRLGRFSPSGVLDSAAFNWAGDSDRLTDYRLRAQFREVGVNAVDALPGLTRISGDVDAGAKSGTLNVVAEGTRVSLPRVFATPLDFDSASAQVSWKIADQVSVKVQRLAFSNADASGSAQGEYRTLPNGPGWSDLTGTITRAKAPSVHKYLPLSVGESVRNWLRDAILTGTASDGRFVLKGNLYDFPFANNQGGSFLVTAKATGAALDYADHWPKIENIKADVKFEGARMEIDASEATSMGIALNRVHVEIPDMGANVSHLVMRGEGGGSTEAFLHYIDASPVGGWINHFTQNAKATGAGRLVLSLDLPLGAYQDAKIAGEYTLASNTIQLAPDIPRAERVSGKLLFSERDFRSQDLTADAFGGTASVQVNVADAKVRVALAGNAELAEVRKQYPFPLSERSRGRADWQFTLQTDPNNYGWVLESSLRGIAIDLPPPLAKKPETALPLRVERQPLDKSRDRLVASLGSVAQMEAIRTVGDKGTEVQRMAISLGRAPARAERDGLWIRGNVDNVEIEPWLAIAGSVGGGDKSAAAGSTDIGFSGIDVRADSTVIFGRRLRNVRVEARNQASNWRIDLDSDDIAGAITWQPPKANANDNGLITARLKKLALPAEEPAPANAPAAAARRELPALDVTSESYVSKNRDLGRLELKARPENADWLIDRLTLHNAESDFVASGRWRVQPNMQRTDLDVKLDVRDVAGFMARFGVTEGLRGGTGTLEGQLDWIGGPQDFNYPTLNGRFGLDVRRGQFTKVEPGIGKLLGVLNLEALARRLTFDFRDVTAEGYSYDEMAGEITLKNGVMTTRNLHISGPAAKVDIAGDADIAKETQHLRIRVQPALTGGLAAAAAAATVNPIVGAGVLLGSTILRDPVGKMFAGEYDVTGTWVEPKVEKLGRPIEAGAEANAPR